MCVGAIVDSGAFCEATRHDRNRQSLELCEKTQLAAELVLLAAVIAQAVVDAKRGDIEALRWLHSQGF